jgi:ADP-heptose:LPS heptosyltransferase
MRQISESDWKKIRNMKYDLLNIACGRINDKISKVIDQKDLSNHQKYLKIWELLKKEDYQISIMFDDLKRSTALQKLAAWKENKLITDEDLMQFSEETRSRINVLAGIQR